MSTRAQLIVIQEHNNCEDDKIMMYHHHDGYPSWMLVEFLKAYNKAITQKYDHLKSFAYRCGKAASYLCSIDPAEFEPESGFNFHGDIEWFYKIFVNCQNKVGEREWQIEIYTTDNSFWDNPCEENLKLFHKRSSLSSFFTEKGILKKKFEET